MAIQFISGLLTGDFGFHAKITVNDPASGFHFALGQSGVNFDPVIAFSGYSGYVFDWSGDFVGGYTSGDEFSISGAMMNETPLRASYHIDDVLIKNSLTPLNNTINSISFDAYRGGSLSIELYESSEEQGVLFLESSDQFTLTSSGGIYLTT